MSYPGQPTPFEVGRGIGENIGKGFQGYQDTSALDQILKQAIDSNDPNVANNMIQQIMARVSPEKQPMAMKVMESKIAGMQQQQSAQSIAKLTGVEEQALKGLSPKEREIFLQNKLNPRIQAADIQSLRKAGLSEDEAALYAIASTGGQTEIMKNIIEGRKRKAQDTLETPQQQAEELIANSDINLTPAERVRRQNDRYKTNLPEFNKLQDKQKTQKAESRRIDFLETLNKTDKLPKGLGLLNVDAKGNLRLPMFSSKEAQAYQKTINEFLQGAKESFGARVTNFEVDLFLKRLPTLWNSKEGRTFVIKQLQIVNKINQLANSGTLDAFKQGGGLRKVDYDKAVDYGAIKNQNEIDALEQEYRQIEDQIEGLSSEQKSLQDIFK